MNSKQVFQTDQHGLFLHAVEAHRFALDPDAWNVPYGAYDDAPPAVKLGEVALRAPEGWTVTPDYRAQAIFQCANGREYQLGEPVLISGETLSYAGWGPLPDWLCDQPKPGDFYQWQRDGWTFDSEAKKASDVASERSWRDAALATNLGIRDRHRDELEIGKVPTLSSNEFTELLLYIDALRMWPQSAQFPDSEFRPTEPQF